MENRKITQPIWTRIILIIITTFMVIVIIESIINKESNNIRGYIGFGLLFTLFLFFTIDSFIVYEFSENTLIIKYPFGLAKNYYLKDIIGCEIDSWDKADGFLSFIIYFKEKYISITLKGKKYKKIGVEICNNIYEKIKNNDIELLNNRALEIVINKKEKIKIYNDRFEQIKNNQANEYYYNKDILRIEKIVLFGKDYKIIHTSDRNKVKIPSPFRYTGGTGFYEYLVSAVKGVK